MRKLVRPMRGEAVTAAVVDAFDRWQMPDERFPSMYYARVTHHAAPDPFSPGTNRVCHHTQIEVWGLGMVDLGWLVIGEEPPAEPVAAVRLTPPLVMGALNAFPFLEHGVSRSGMPYTQRWPEFLRTMELTTVALALHTAMASSHHPVLTRFMMHCQYAGKFDGEGMLEWLPTLGAAHLASEEWM